MPGRNLRILIVEDDPVFATALELRIGADHNAEYRHATDCPSAIEECRSTRFDLVTLDYRIPGGDGLQLLSEINRIPDPPPVIMVTGHGDEDVASRAFRAGAAGYVAKDHRLAALLPETIKSVLEREESRRAAETSERRFRFIADNVSDVIWTADLEFRKTYTSPSVERLLGYTVEEAMFLPLRATMTPESFRRFEQAVEEELEGLARGGGPGNVRTLELEEVRKDGSTVRTETSIQLISPGYHTPRSILCVTRDITDRARAAEALRERDERLRVIAANTFDYFWMTDLEMNFTYANAAVARLGYTIDEVMSMKLGDIATPASLGLAARILERELEIAGETAHIPATIFTLELLRKDGTVVETEVSAGFLRDADGSPYGLLGTAREVRGRPTGGPDPG